MKRALTLLGATAAGFTSIVALHGTNGSSGPLLNASPATSSPATSSPATSSPATSSPATSSPATSSPATSSPATSSPATSSPVTSGSSPTSGGATAVGQTENYGYGTMSVKVTVAQNHIVNVKVNSLTTLESYSQQLAQYAVPILKAEVLKAQGTRISALTGATYTSEAYAYSIQSALDKLHFK